ncbi:MAG TPA: MEDS domain-containing protein [Oligoflexus sp.]|uniref:MEDS domain-containing protein n=1 Tax=Oligoflexus sp. TaxID=1971216 RepID=UPI002D46FCE8|nr:MEDS domain-containing protein [Oligoflexus sp.]HYX33483.1 MEDS domain-containing protein [Oligoflexus sp.]
MVQSDELQNFCADHMVQFYKNPEYLSESVGEYIRLGLAKGDGIFVLATQDHWDSLKRTLLEKDPVTENYLTEQQLVFIDAHQALRQILHHGRPNKEAFINFIGNTVGRMHAYANIRAYGELVDVLCAAGKIDEAIQLEQYWNEVLQAEPRLSLMCGYSADHVGEHVSHISQVHSHVLCVENITKLDDEEALYRRIAILEQRYAALKHDFHERDRVESELLTIKKQLMQAGKLSILGELCAGIGHELNNPLAIILGCIKHSKELVARTPEPIGPSLREILKRLDYIDDASTRMTKIVRNVLMFARQQAHSLNSFDLKNTVQDAIEFMQPSLRLEQIQMQLILPTTELYSLGDTDAILQAFVNIMSNARDALAGMGPTSGRMLIVSAQKTQDHKIEIAFRDTGIGMDEQTLGKVFYPFFTTKGIGKGTGMGLAIAHGIITQHNGQIICDSKPGQGTVVRAILPELAESSTARRA